MQTVRVGNSDLYVSRVGIGCNSFGPMIGEGLDQQAATAVVDAALEAGITFFDTAEAYAAGVSERYLGKALQGRRDEAVIATKFLSREEPAFGSAAYIRAAIDRSLERLGTDYVDLYYYHRPDGVTPIAETLGALDELVKAGKIRYAGCSNFDAAQLREAEESARSNGTVRFVALQNEYNLLKREADEEVLPLCRELGIGFVPYFPLASGLLTGKYRRGAPAPAGSRLSVPMVAERLERAPFDEIEKLEAFAHARGRTLVDLAIAGVAAQPGISGVIAGASSPEQVRANAKAAEWELDPAELDQLL